MRKQSLGEALTLAVNFYSKKLRFLLPKSAWSQLQIAAFLAIPATKMQATWRGFYRRKKFLTMKRSGMRHRGGRDVPPAAPTAIPILFLTFIPCIILLKIHILTPMPYWKLVISRVGFPEHFWCQFCEGAPLMQNLCVIFSHHHPVLVEGNPGTPKSCQEEMGSGDNQEVCEEQPKPSNITFLNNKMLKINFPVTAEFFKINYNY